VDLLPSAEVQLEKFEAELKEKGKEVIRSTPLIDFLREKWVGLSLSSRFFNPTTLMILWLIFFLLSFSFSFPENWKSVQKGVGQQEEETT